MEWRYLRQALQEYADALDTNAKSNMPQDWKLRESISFTLAVSGAFYSVEFKAPEYWKWAENGRRPGKMPPVSAILEWIEAKRIVPYADANGRVPSLNSLAFLIARKIGRDGTEGVHFLEKAVQETEFEDIISDAISKDISEEWSNILNPISGIVK